jgi:hypothetical protein
MKPASLRIRLAIAVVAGLFPAVAGIAAAPTTQSSKLRIGVYDSRAVAIAYVRSGAMETALKDLKAQRDEAKKKGDEKRVQEIEAQGANGQTLRHLQGFSNAPVDDILSQIKDKLPGIAKDASVDVIVARMDYQTDNVEPIDVTDRIVALFNPDEKTSKIISELRKREPYPMIQILGMKE